jgi:putative inorganic carbon (hco3(-)) transporter
MNILIAVFFFSLCIGQLGAIPVHGGSYVYFHDCIAVILVIATAISLIRRKKSIVGRVMVPIGVFIVFSIFSLIMNMGHLPWSDVFSGSLYLIRYIFYALLYFVVLNTSTPSYWIKMLFGYGCVFAFLGLLQFILYPQLANLTYLGWDPHYYRLFSTILDPNYASLLIGLTIILGTVYWDVWPMWATISCNSILVLALVLTYSRSGFLAFIASGIMYMFLTKRYKMLILFGVFVMLFVFIPRSPFDVTRMLRKTSSIARINNFQSSWDLAIKSPVIGFGFNTIRYIQLKSASIKAKNVVSRAGAGIDSSVLFLLATVGFIGTSIYGWLLYRIIIVCIHVLKRIKEGKSVAIVILATLTAIFVHSNFNNSLFYAWIMIWVWILVGVVERYFTVRK